MSRLTIEGVDPDLKRQFKIWCINNQTTMREQIIAWMERTLKDNSGKGKRAG